MTKKIKVTRSVKVTSRVDLSHREVADALRAYLEIPEGVTLDINVYVPTNHYSGQTLDIDADTPLVVTWETKEES